MFSSREIAYYLTEYDYELFSNINIVSIALAQLYLYRKLMNLTVLRMLENKWPTRFQLSYDVTCTCHSIQFILYLSSNVFLLCNWRNCKIHLFHNMLRERKPKTHASRVDRMGAWVDAKLHSIFGFSLEFRHHKMKFFFE